MLNVIIVVTTDDAKCESVRITGIILDLECVIVDSKRVVLSEYEYPLLCKISKTSASVSSGFETQEI